MPLTEETIRSGLPERLQNIGLGLLRLGFRIDYSCREEEVRAGRRIPPRGYLAARKGAVSLKVIITWISPDRAPEVHLYEVESIAGHEPGLSRRGRKSFWNAAKGAS